MEKGDKKRFTRRWRRELEARLKCSGVRELAELEHLEHLSDSVIEEYEDSAVV